MHGSELVRRLFHKRDLLMNGDPAHGNIRTMLIIMSGGMRGASGGGAAIGLHHLGLSDVFDTVLGVSTGAPTAAYFLGGLAHARTGFEVYCEAAQRLIHPFQRPMFDVDGLEEILRSGEKGINVEAIKKSRSQLYVMVTDRENAGYDCIDTQLPYVDVVTAIKASLAMPGRLYGKPVFINGVAYVAGGVAFPLPHAWIKGRRPTDLLIIANRGYGLLSRVRTRCADELGSRLLMHGEPYCIREALRLRTRRMYPVLTELRQMPLHLGIIWSDDSLNFLTRDVDELRAAERHAREETIDFFMRSR
ncbi:MAG: patatin-like phospholipase family protein [Patescibacteria group bacterium]